LREAAVLMEIDDVVEREAISKNEALRQKRAQKRRKARLVKAATGKMLAEIKPKIAEMRTEGVVKLLTLEEKIFILEAHFNKGVGIKQISKDLSRSIATVRRFVNQFRSTHLIAKLRFAAQADNLAKKVIAKADVDQAMEVLDRIDVLPRKERSKGPEVPQLNIIVGMPGQPSAIPAPSQKTIEASKVP